MHSTILIAAVLYPAALLAQAQPLAAPPWLVAIEAVDGQTKEYSTGLIVGTDGLIASTWESLAGAEKIKVGIPRIGMREVDEVYAASRGKGLVILKLKDPPANLTPAVLADDLPVPGAALTVIGMASAARGIAFELGGKLSYTVTGEQLLDAFAALKPRGTGFDRDAVWLRLSLLYVPTQNGAALMSDATNSKVVGMIIPSITPKDSFANAIHACHIAELLRNPLDHPLPLSQLHRHIDEPPQKPVVPKFSLSDTLWDRGLALTARGTKFKERKKVLDAALDAADRSDVERKKQIVPLKTAMNKLKSRASAIENEIKKARPEGYVPSASRAPNPGERGRDGKRLEKDDRVTIPGFVLWSPEVIAAARALTAEYQALAAEWNDLNQQFMAIEAEQALTNFERDLREKMSRKHIQHFLETADVAGFRPASEHLAAIDAYSEDLLVDRPLTGARLLARSWSYLHLGKFPEAEADLLAAAKTDINKAVGSASLARLWFRAGKRVEGAAQLARAEPAAKDNALALQILGLIACEDGRPADGVKLFEQALAAPGDQAETLRLAALVYATGPAMVRDQARATEYALRARQLTHSLDEGSLLALGAAFAEAGDFDKAEKAAADAEALAEPDLVPFCQSWRVNFKQLKPIRDLWPEKSR